MFRALNRKIYHHTDQKLRIHWEMTGCRYTEELFSSMRINTRGFLGQRLSLYKFYLKSSSLIDIFPILVIMLAQLETCTMFRLLSIISLTSLVIFLYRVGLYLKAKRSFQFSFKF